MLNERNEPTRSWWSGQSIRSGPSAAAGMGEASRCDLQHPSNVWSVEHQSRECAGEGSLSRNTGADSWRLRRWFRRRAQGVRRRGGSEVSGSGGAGKGSCLLCGAVCFAWLTVYDVFFFLSFLLGLYCDKISTGNLGKLCTIYADKNIDNKKK